MDTADIKQTSEEWQKECDYIVTDADGWDRKNYHYSWYVEKITYDEFLQRLIRSTITGRN